ASTRRDCGRAASFCPASCARQLASNPPDMLHNPVTLHIDYATGENRPRGARSERLNVHVSPSGYPALVLNADFRPLSYYPLSLWCWQDTIKAVFLERVNIVANYDRAVHSPSFEMKLPSV